LTTEPFTAAQAEVAFTLACDGTIDPDQIPLAARQLA
jgi:hypothetical protein